MKLNLQRPIVFFDLETTGVQITRDRIVEISILKISPDGERETKTRRINPEMPSPQRPLPCMASRMPMSLTAPPSHK